MATRIFVVDDERSIADTLAVILRNSGYEATPFYNAKSALVEVESSSPELVIIDVVMPQMSGVDIAVLVAECHPKCKVLLMSGQVATAAILERVRTYGYNFELLTKPVHPTDLLAKVETLINSKN